MMQAEIKGIKYEIRPKKNVKRINIHVELSGNVWISCPIGITPKEIDKIMLDKIEWIKRAQAKNKLRREEKAACNDDLFALTTTECLFRFNPLADNVWELIKHKLKHRFPTERPYIRVVDEKSRWGACNPKENFIRLSYRLMRMPDKTIEAIILHEFCHYLEPNHQINFHNIMAELMPDYKEREKPLKHY